MQSTNTPPAGTINGLRIPEPQPTSPLAAALEEARVQRDRADRAEAALASRCDREAGAVRGNN